MSFKTRTILALGKTEPWGSVQISHPVTFPFIYFTDSLSRSLDFYSSTMGAEQSRKVAESFDTNDDGELSASEIHHYTDEHLELWLALSEQCGINENACRKIVVQVAMAMATKDDTKPPRNPTTKEFGAFLHKLGAQQKTRDEFFHRTVFVAFDTNQNGTLERKELFGFLDVLYNSAAKFGALDSLPKKETLKTSAISKFDVNHDNVLDVQEFSKLLHSLDIKGAEQVRQ